MDPSTSGNCGEMADSSDDEVLPYEGSEVPAPMQPPASVARVDPPPMTSTPLNEQQSGKERDLFKTQNSKHFSLFSWPMFARCCCIGY